MPRLTRQESQQITRQKLIQSAEKEILRKGVYKASIRRICDAAGYTLGAFYSNFKDKDELLLEVVAIQIKSALDILNVMISSSASLGEKEVLDKTAEWLHALRQNKIVSDLSLEFESYASHNPAFKRRYIENKKQWHAQTAQALETLFVGQGLVPKISASQMAIGLTALWSGLIMESALASGNAADEIILLFLGSLLESAKRKR